MSRVSIHALLLGRDTTAMEIKRYDYLLWYMKKKKHLRVNLGLVLEIL